MNKILLLFTISIFLVSLGANEVLASEIVVGSDAEITVDSGTSLTINTDNTNNLDNQGTINIEDTGEINIGSTSSSSALLKNDGTINGPGQINLFGIDISVENTGSITAIINEIFTKSKDIGGELISIDKSGLLVAGIQSSIFLWLPAVLIIGASLVIIKAKWSVQINE